MPSDLRFLLTSLFALWLWLAPLQLGAVTFDPRECPSSFEVLNASEQRALKRRQKQVEELLSTFGFSEVTPVAMGGYGQVFAGRDKTGTWHILKLLPGDGGVEALARASHETDTLNYLNQKYPGDPRFPAATLRTLPVGTEVLQMISFPMVPFRPGQSTPAPTLHDFLRHNPEEFAKHWEQIRDDILVQLDRVHDAGVVHADIKPNNVIVYYDETGKMRGQLIDWGLAHAAYESAPAHPLTRLSPQEVRIVGTMHYLPLARFQGVAPQMSHDVFALTLMSWEVRAKQAGNRQGLIPLVTWHSREPISRPVVAQDESGTMEQRLIALAEWSPHVLDAGHKRQLISEAKSLPPQEFLRRYGRQLDLMAGTNDPAGAREVALEVLSSHVLTDNIATDGGVQISKATLEAVVRAAIALQATANEKGADAYFTTPGNAPNLLFGKLAARIDALAAQGQTKPWAKWKAEVSPPPPQQKRPSVWNKICDKFAVWCKNAGF